VKEVDLGWSNINKVKSRDVGCDCKIDLVVDHLIRVSFEHNPTGTWKGNIIRKVVEQYYK
jgi:hypothetical protein